MSKASNEMTVEEMKALIQRMEDANSSIQVGVSVSAQQGVFRTRRSSVDVPWIEYSWDLHEHSPIYYTNIKFKAYRSGDWEHSCNVENRSGHSDWDVWIDFWMYSDIIQGNAFDICNACWEQDLDSGENYNKSARGFSTNIRDSWGDLWNGTTGTLSPRFTTHKIRDN